MSDNPSPPAGSKDLVAKATEPGFWREIQMQGRLLWALLRDPDVPFYLKAIPFLPLIYVLWPADLLPDIFPILGQIDDVTALVIGARVFMHLSPQDVVARYRAELEAERASGEDAELKGRIVVEGDDPAR